MDAEFDDVLAGERVRSAEDGGDGLVEVVAAAVEHGAYDAGIGGCVDDGAAAAPHGLRNRERLRTTDARHGYAAYARGSGDGAHGVACARKHYFRLCHRG